MPLRPFLAILLLPLICVGPVCTPSFASATRAWTEKNLGEPGAGSYQGVMYSDRGRLAPGIRTEKKLYREDLSFWCGAYESSGALLAGGGSPPFVVRLNREGVFVPLSLGGIVKDGKDAGNSVSVLRALSHDRVVVGYAGNGVVGIRHPAKPDEFAVLCKLPVRGVWDLAEGDDGFLYAATGPLGQIYRINCANGAFEVWAQLKDTNVRSLCWQRGRLLAGGGDSGNLYRVQGKGRVETLHHFQEESVQRISVYRDFLVVAVNKLRLPADEKAEDSYKKYFKKLSDLPQGFGIDEKMPAPADGLRQLSSNYASGALYLLGKDYRIDRLAALKDDHIMDQGVDGDGRVYLATGPKGLVYLVRAQGEEERELWTVQELEYVNATAVVLKDGSPRAFLAAGQEAAAFLRVEGKGRSGSVRTRAYSSGRPAVWGALAWRGVGVKVFTRNGHAPKPDGTWTRWVERTNGRALPAAGKAWSYAQLRVDMTGKAEFSGFSWRFAEKNQRPQIASLQVGERELSSGGAQRQVSWEASDPNGDRLEYRVAVREESDPTWREVSGPQPLSEPKFVLPVAKMPDGRYFLRVTASDAPDNYQAPLTISRTSSPFIINNARPEIRDLSFDPATARLTARVVDRLSIITGLAFSLDGGEWRQIAPADGIFDEKEEAVRVSLPGLAAGRHTVSLRALDETGNEAVQMLEVSLANKAAAAAPEEPVVDDDPAEPVAAVASEPAAVR